jgi:phosphate transport system substrate-binding protein
MTARIPALFFLALITLPVAASCGPGEVEVPPGAILLKGAGATFPAPLYDKWIQQYQQEHEGVVIDYKAVGSGKGTEYFLEEMVDFGASDAALTDEQIGGVPRGVLLVPSTAGSVAIAYNVGGLSDDIRLSREIYADIFLGKIDSWNDERIAAANPNLQLPDLALMVVARQDSSGTTFAFTNHLAAISQEWAKGPGVGKEIGWPGGAMLAPGNEGVAARIQRTPGAIGYVEYGIASRAGLKMALLENKEGNYVQPSATSGFATLTSTELPDNFRAFFPDPEGLGSYPIVTYSWLLLYRRYDDAGRSDELRRFVTWCLTEGQQYNEELGYIRLAPEAVERLVAAVETIE